jgi:UDP-3-O-[3-hydroxymyristoyl] glucosamine N-acyltransferase
VPRTARPVSLAALAEFLGLPLSPESADLPIQGFASLSGAAHDELVFLRSASHLGELHESAARAVLAPEGLEVGGRAVLRTARPAQDFNRLIFEFAPRARPASGIAPGALVDPSARVDVTASIASGAIVGPGCRVGARSVLAPGAILVAEVAVGDDCWIHAGSVLREETRVGDRVVLQPGVVLGGDGFGYAPNEAGRPSAIAQRGCVVVEDDVEIGANTTVDRATLDVTRIRRGAKIDNLVQIAHNCDIGEDALIVAQTGLSGGTVVGRRAIIMAQAGSTGHLRIGDRAFVGARTGLHRDVPDGTRVFGAPQMEERGWHRAVAALRRLPALLKRVRRIERALEDRAGGGGPSAGDSDSD